MPRVKLPKRIRSRLPRFFPSSSGTSPMATAATAERRPNDGRTEERSRSIAANQGCAAGTGIAPPVIVHRHDLHRNHGTDRDSSSLRTGLRQMRITADRVRFLSGINTNCTQTTAWNRIARQLFCDNRSRARVRKCRNGTFPGSCPLVS